MSFTCYGVIPFCSYCGFLMALAKAKQCFQSSLVMSLSDAWRSHMMQRLCSTSAITKTKDETQPSLFCEGWSGIQHRISTTPWHPVGLAVGYPHLGISHLTQPQLSLYSGRITTAPATHTLTHLMPRCYLEVAGLWAVKRAPSTSCAQASHVSIIWSWLVKWALLILYSATVLYFLMSFDFFAFFILFII